MPNIYYYRNTAGTYVAKWPGKGRRVDGRSVKEGQLYLGRVVSQEKLVFFKRGLGYYRFDPATLACEPIGQDEVPPYDGPPDLRHRDRPVVCSFGGCYLVHALVEGTGYRKEVLSAIPFGNRDTLLAMLMYYVLCDEADRHAWVWYNASYASYLYPRANIASQRVSDMLARVGTEDARRAFLEAHIRYLMSCTDESYYLMVDSTGLPNACSVPITKVSNHEGDINVEFRLIAVVQRSTGLPVWYEVIPGNVVDVSTLDNVVRKLGLYGCKVLYVPDDAGYCCPANMERLILAGVDFMTRMNPAYDNYRDVLQAHYDELASPGHENVVRYRDRLVRVIKVRAAIATVASTGEAVEGWVYLCRDIQGHHDKCDRLMRDRKKTRGMTSEEIMAACDRFGVFAIVSTVELATDEVLPEYYARQAVEQLFDFAKGCGKMLPVRNRTMDTIRGHMLMSFAATFLHVLMKNRMGLLDARWAGVPRALAGAVTEADGEAVEVGDGDAPELVIAQEPVESAFRLGTRPLLYYLQLQSAEVFPTEIVPAVATREAKDLTEAFGLPWPVTVMRRADGPEPVYREGERDRCTRARAFARRPSVTDEDVERARERRRRKAAKAAADAVAAEAAEADGASGADDAKPQVETPQAEAPKPRRRPGRPKGSKNKKTLEREAEIARQKAEGTYVEPPKRKRGRPKGSKNKKTPEREERERASAETAGRE